MTENPSQRIGITDHDNEQNEPQGDAFIGKWDVESKKLRAILLDSELTEEFNWSQPCYTFREKDRSRGQHSQSTRWIKFTSVREIAEMKSVLKGRGTVNSERLSGGVQE